MLAAMDSKRRPIKIKKTPGGYRLDSGPAVRRSTSTRRRMSSASIGPRRRSRKQRRS